MSTHSFHDERSGLRDQKYINRWFKFKQGETAKCKAHEVTRCQFCTHVALKFQQEKEDVCNK